MPRRSARVADEKLLRIVKQITTLHRHRSKTTTDRATLVRQFADLLATPGVDVNRLVSGTRHTLFGELIGQHAIGNIGRADSLSLLEYAHLLAKHAGTDVNCTTKYRQGPISVLDTLIQSIRDKKKVHPILTAMIAHPELIVSASKIRQALRHNHDDDTLLSLIDHPSMAHATIESNVLTAAAVRGRERVVRRLLRHPGVRVNERVNERSPYVTPLEGAVRMCESECELYGSTPPRLRILRALVEHDRCAVQELRIAARGADICEDVYKILLKSERFDMHNIRTRN